VCHGNARKYYRFRKASFYGGIATADVVGCNLRCRMCWAWNVLTRPKKYGKFYSPAEVAKKLTEIAKKCGFDRVRISGNEPTIGRTHLLKVLELIPENLLFILETNGILLADESYVKDLSRFKNVHVRVSLKGACQAEFGRITGAEPRFFDYQLKALKNLVRYGVSSHPAVLVDLVAKENLNKLKKRLDEIGPTLKLEYEHLIKYPNVLARLKIFNFYQTR
jgi:uncharacterized Fe-S cluster-containing radical SAM superfamily protein